MKFLPVTCVKFIANSSQILSASGNEVNLLDYNRNTVVDVLSINKLKVIHGIELKDNIVIIYGGFVFCICLLVDNKINFTNIFQRHDDFILACMIYFHQEDEIKFCISLAHGSTKFYSFRLGVKQQLEGLGEVSTSDKSLLYCCHLFRNPAVALVNKLFLAGGNVQNLITIWEIPSPPFTQLLPQAPVLSRLAGHKGAIFCIHMNWSDGLLISMGDERSVILWLAQGHFDRLANTLAGVNWVRSAVLIGHGARVWGGLSLAGDDGVMAWGEDCTLRIWARDGTSRACIQPHTGRSIWAGDVMMKPAGGGSGGGGSKYLIATGGNDGAVVLSECARNPDGQQAAGLSICRFDGNCKDFPRRLISVYGGMILIVTDLGKFHLISERHQQAGQCRMESVNCDIANGLLNHYCFMFSHHANHAQQLVLLGNAHGIVFVTRLQFTADGSPNLITLATFELGHKIMAIGAAIDTHAIVALNNGQMVLIARHGADQFNISLLATIAGDKWAACWTQWWSPDQAGQQVLHLVCGDRDGWLHAFKLAGQSHSQLQLVATNKRKLSEKSGITCLFWHDRHQRIYVGTKSGDVFSLDGNGGLDKEVVVVRNPDMIGWICRIEASEDGLLITGFKSILFRRLAVHGSGQHPVVLIERPCGGGHREWDYSVWSGSARLAFIQAQAVHVVSWHDQCAQPLVVKPHLHGKEINSCSFIGRGADIVLLTGSEDCSLAVVAMTTECALQSVRRIHGHISSVRCVTELITDNLMVSAGGRGQLMFWQRNPHDYSLRAVASALLPKLVNVDTDSRIMDICAVPNGNRQIVAVAGSCGSLTFLSLPPGSNRPQLLLLYRLSKSCITNVAFISSLLIACSTDGKLYWFPNGPPDTERYQHKSQPIGKSGLQGMDIQSANPTGSTVLVSVGGDDGSVSVASINRVGTDWNLSSSCTHSVSHLGSTVSTKWLPQADNDNYNTWLASLGSDGRLILWMKLINDGVVALSMIRYISHAIGVTDPHTMAVTRHPLYQSRFLFCVVGMGAHIFEFDLGSED